jgi:HEAT repeat protein
MERPRRRIDDLTDRLAEAQDLQQRLQAAIELRDASYATRFSLENRGSLATPAESQLEEGQLNVLTGALVDDDREVRRAAIASAGGLGGASLISPLIDQLGADDEIRLAAIDALGDIGGMESVEALAGLATEPQESADVRLAALTELEQLTAKEITSGPDRYFQPPEDSAVGDRQRVALEMGGDAKSKVFEAVNLIQADEVADDFLKLKAQDIQIYLEGGVG